MNVRFSSYRKGLFSFLDLVWPWTVSLLQHYCSCWARNTKFLWLGYADSSVPKDRSNKIVLIGIIVCERNKEMVSQIYCSSFFLPAKLPVQQENIYMSIWPNYPVGNLGLLCPEVCSLQAELVTLTEPKLGGKFSVKLLRRMKDKEQRNSLFG